MALGQSSGGWTESSSALRIMYAGTRNSTGLLTSDSFTQTNPPIVTTQASSKIDVATFGVLTGCLSGSVAFARPDGGQYYIGGPKEGLADGVKQSVVPVGVFVNDVTGNAFENLPAAASGRGTYVSGMGTYGNSLYETKTQIAINAGIADGVTIVYQVGQSLAASRNGYLMPTRQGATASSLLGASAGGSYNFSELENGASAVTVIGVLKAIPDSTMAELIYDQRI
jgi:hypothetical protein